MTTILSTKSHGEIESGFESVFVDFVKFGDYFFSTRDFCNTVRVIAESPADHKFTIVGFPIEELESETADAMQRMIGEAFTSSRRKDGAIPHVEMHREIIEFDDKNPKGRVRQRRITKDFKELKIEIATNSKNSEITVGKYVIKADDFAWLAYAVAVGGFNGWAKPAPKFATELKNALNSTSNDLFRDLNKGRKPLKTTS
ncbi:MAG: hypothetical protein KGH61_04615 [Candidatus Micrarchaeota archaeon]|nr:hypothetical protein [Candidatus Micrarchaeota archaeon]MDE1848200.1 hypothetical protein [Candidatus Micrarchaeota archaeon]MDE1864848.1 hypothetical protein [Candidatus Micrarchaeota archaeon]